MKENVDIKEMYEIILPLATNLYEAFPGIQLSPVEYSNLILEEINATLNIFSNKEEFVSYIIKALEKRLINLSENKENTSKYAMLSNYIDTNFLNVNTYDGAIKAFSNLNRLIKKDFYETDFLMELINKNDTFTGMLKLIYQHDYAIIKNGLKEEFFNNYLLYLALQTYLVLNDMSINYENSSDASYSSNEQIYLNEIKKIPLLPIEEEKELTTRVAMGDSKAKKKLIESNLGLVVSIAKRFYGGKLSLLDLIQEGNIGLMKAADKYDNSKGCRFNTYAYFWINQTISRAIIEKSRNISIPVHAYEQITKITKTKDYLENELGREVSISELAKKLNMPVDKIIKLYNARYDTVSMNNLTIDDDLELGETIADDSINIEDKVAKEELRSELIALIQNSNLNKTQKQVIMYHFGLVDGKMYTLAQIGRMLNFTRQRANQVATKALKILQASDGIEKFSIYLEDPEESLENLQKIRGSLARDNFKFKTIYDYLRRFNYKEDDINKMLRKLSRDDLDIIYKVFICDEISDEEFTQSRNDLSKLLLPKMRFLLAHPDFSYDVNNRMVRMPKTIYQFLGEPKELVDKMLSMLTEDELNLIKLKYGNVLDIPFKANLTKAESNRFYNKLVPKMRAFISFLSHEENTLTELKEASYILNIAFNNHYLAKPEYVKMLKLIKSPEFQELLLHFTATEALIIAFESGYLKPKEFKIGDLANILRMNKIELREVYKNTLVVYERYKLTKENLENDNVKIKVKEK